MHLLQRLMKLFYLLINIQEGRIGEIQAIDEIERFFSVCDSLVKQDWR